MTDLLDAVREPLADLLRAVADWLDDDTEEPEPEPDPKPRYVINERGGFDLA